MFRVVALRESKGFEMLGVVFCVERADTKTHVIKILYYESAHELYHWAIYEAWL